MEGRERKIDIYIKRKRFKKRKRVEKCRKHRGKDRMKKVYYLIIKVRKRQAKKGIEG